jgi:hypothetical protein
MTALLHRRSDLLVAPIVGKRWWFKYQCNGKERLLACTEPHAENESSGTNEETGHEE